MYSPLYSSPSVDMVSDSSSLSVTYVDSASVSDSSHSLSDISHSLSVTSLFLASSASLTPRLVERSMVRPAVYALLEPGMNVISWNLSGLLEGRSDQRCIADDLYELLLSENQIFHFYHEIVDECFLATTPCTSWVCETATRVISFCMASLIDFDEILAFVVLSGIGSVTFYITSWPYMSSCVFMGRRRTGTCKFSYFYFSSTALKIF